MQAKHTQQFANLMESCKKLANSLSSMLSFYHFASVFMNHKKKQWESLQICSWVRLVPLLHVVCFCQIIHYCGYLGLYILPERSIDRQSIWGNQDDLQKFSQVGKVTAIWNKMKKFQKFLIEFLILQVVFSCKLCVYCSEDLGGISLKNKETFRGNSLNIL